jgi:hypothetical protein
MEPSASNEEGTEMAFTEVMATDRAGGLFASKAAMKRAHAENPASVRFESVSPMGPQFDGTVESPADLPDGLKLTVVGPNPFTDRRWYGTVEVKNGKVKIS